MVNGKTGFFEEAPGVRSSTRLIFIIGSLAVLAMTALMVWRGSVTPFDVGTFLCMGLGALGATKVSGAIAEKKQEPKTDGGQG